MKFKKSLVINIPETVLDKETWGKLSDLAEKVVQLEKDSPHIMTEIQDTDCLLVNFGSSVTKEMIDAASNLKYIGVLATAFGKIDVEYAKEKGIPVANLAGYSTNSVAEFTIATILEHIRGLEIGKQRGRDKNYSELGIEAREIKGSTFGVVGLGTIGTRVAELAHGFGADVIYNSRNEKDMPQATYKNIDDVLAESDFLSINLAQTPKTEGFFDKEKLTKIKEGAVVVNTAPMEIIDIDALAERLAKGDMAFILDHSDEMTEADLVKLEPYQNCIVYPPLAYITNEAAEAKKDMFIQNMNSFLQGFPENVVNTK